MLVNLSILYDRLHGNSMKGGGGWGGGSREIYEGLIFTEGLMVDWKVLHEIEEQFKWNESVTVLHLDCLLTIIE